MNPAHITADTLAIRSIDLFFKVIFALGKGLLVFFKNRGPFVVRLLGSKISQVVFIYQISVLAGLPAKRILNHLERTNE